jgi:hypothetical protein
VNRKRFLRVLGTTAEDWARRYEIIPVEHPCGVCGAPCKTTLPFAIGELRGLMSPPCKCGNKKTPYCLVRDPKYGDLFTLKSRAPNPAGELRIGKVQFSVVPPEKTSEERRMLEGIAERIKAKLTGDEKP